jgi:hypothetical protein
MLKKYVSKFTIDILPSVLATIIGAYIVNHYIIAKPADAPAAAVASTPETKKVDAKSPGIANIPESGVKAKGISEKALLEKTASERPAVADRPAEIPSLPVESRRVQPAPHEKPVGKSTPAAASVSVQTPASASAPVEAAAVPEEKRDVNDLARAAIERLRGTTEASRVQEAVRIPEAPRAAEAPHAASAPAVLPLPPPIMVSTPNSEAFNPATGSLPLKPPYGSAMRDDRRPTPPADIPSSLPPVDLRAEAELPAPRQRTSVAEEVLSAAKSVFHAVLPR